MNSVLSTRKNKRANPIARAPGSIDVNTKLDTSFLQKSRNAKHKHLVGTNACYDKEGTDDIYDVLEGEILMGQNSVAMSYKGRTNLCFSSANGLRKGTDEKGHATDALNDYVYAGVAVTGYSQENDKPREQQGFVASFAGLMTMMNSGTENIYPGDILRVTMPTTDDKKRPAHVKGTPKGKIVFGLAPVTKTNYEEVIQAMKSYLRKTAIDAAWADDEKKSVRQLIEDYPIISMHKFIMDGELPSSELPPLPNTVIRSNKFLKFICDEMESLRRFEIGRAMGFARPGHALDVCLG